MNNDLTTAAVRDAFVSKSLRPHNSRVILEAEFDAWLERVQRDAWTAGRVSAAVFVPEKEES